VDVVAVGDVVGVAEVVDPWLVSSVGFAVACLAVRPAGVSGHPDVTAISSAPASAATGAM
jgi:hypothetical protein